MDVLEHWHPVAFSNKLSDKPIGVRIAGHEIALFRTKDGGIGAVNDVCAHRRMRLSLGSVVNDRLQCPYHGWTFDTHGAGESPGTPKLHAKTGCYEVCERHGAVWVRTPGSERSFPEFDVAGFEPTCTVMHMANAPLAVVLDNFTEVEHTSTVHYLLGYSLESMSEVETRVDSTDDSVYVYNVGPQKHVFAPLTWAMGFANGDYFVDEWTTRFSPVHTVYDQYWLMREGRKERDDRLRIYVFFNPIDEHHTQLVTFVYTRSSRWIAKSAKWAIAPLLRYLVDLEVRRDTDMLDKLADKSPQIEGMRLSRFDKVLGLTRARMERIYYATREARRDDAVAIPAETAK